MGDRIGNRGKDTAKGQQKTGHGHMPAKADGGHGAARYPNFQWLVHVEHGPFFHLSQKMSQRVCEKQMWMTSQTPIHEEKIKREFTDHCIFFVFIGMSQEH